MGWKCADRGIALFNDIGSRAPSWVASEHGFQRRLSDVRAAEQHERSAAALALAEEVEVVLRSSLRPLRPQLLAIVEQFVGLFGVGAQTAAADARDYWRGKHKQIASRRGDVAPGGLSGRCRSVPWIS